MNLSHRLHPFLIALVPVAYLANQNAHELFAVDAAWVGFVMIALTAGILAPLIFLPVNLRRKSFLLVSAFYVSSFGYVHFLQFLKNLDTGFLLKAGKVGWLLLWFILFVAICRAKKSALSQLASFATALAAILLIINSLGYVSKWYSMETLEDPASPILDSHKIRRPQTPRDIYYIVLDRYAGEKTLSEQYNFDNTPFLDSLRSRGFSIPRGCYANYLKTSLSLSSSLNMTHLLFLEDSLGTDSKNWKPLHRMIQHNRTVQMLRNAGYSYVHLPTLWDGTRSAPEADRFLGPNPPSEFAWLLLTTNAVYPFLQKLEQFGFRVPILRRYKQHQLTRRKMTALASMHSMESPKFVFAHFLLPHEPYTFTADGEYLSLSDAREHQIDSCYLDQLRFTNSAVLQMIDSILAHSTARPIILIQADEGPYPKRFRGSQKTFDWIEEARQDELEKKLGILIAAHLPEIDRKALYDGITPVNLFRLVFNSYFGADFPFLEDRSYAFRNAVFPYSFHDVTSRLSRISLDTVDSAGQSFLPAE